VDDHVRAGFNAWHLTDALKMFDSYVAPTTREIIMLLMRR
jgi:hypothetical protein